MKRITAVLCVLAIMCATLVACGKSEDKSKLIEGTEKEVSTTKNGNVNEAPAKKAPVVPEEPATDPAAYWKEHAEDLWYNGRYTINTFSDKDGVPIGMRMDFYDEDYSIRIDVSGSGLTLTKLGDIMLLVTGEGKVLRCSMSEFSGEGLEVTQSTDFYKDMTDNMTYLESDGNVDTFTYIDTDDETGEEITYKVYASRDDGGITKLTTDEAEFDVLPFKEELPDVESFGEVEEVDGNTIAEELIGSIFMLASNAAMESSDVEEFSTE